MTAGMCVCRALAVTTERAERDGGALLERVRARALRLRRLSGASRGLGAPGAQARASLGDHAGDLDRHRRPERGGGAARAHRQPARGRLSRRTDSKSSSSRTDRPTRRADILGGVSVDRSTSFCSRPAARPARSTRASPPPGTTCSCSPTRGRPLPLTRCARSSRPWPIRASAASRANCCSTANRATRDSTIGEGVGAYWRYEKWLRRHESLVGSTVGSTGRDLRPSPRALAAAAGRNDSRRRARADAGGARPAPGSSSRARRGPTTASPPVAQRRVPAQDAHARGQLSDPPARAAAAGPVRQSGLAPVRLAQARTPASCRTRSARSWSRARRSPDDHWFYAVAFAGQLAFYGLALYGAVLERRGRQELRERSTTHA